MMVGEDNHLCLVQMTDSCQPSRTGSIMQTFLYRPGLALRVCSVAYKMCQNHSISLVPIFAVCLYHCNKKYLLPPAMLSFLGFSCCLCLVSESTQTAILGSVRCVITMSSARLPTENTFIPREEQAGHDSGWERFSSDMMQCRPC